MAIYGVYACEGKYNGLHGMNKYGFIEADSVSLANEYGAEWSEEVMASYDTIEQEAREWVESEDYEEGTEEYEEAMADFYLENQEYYVIKIRDDCPLTLAQLQENEYNDFHELCKKWGDEEWDGDTW